MSHQSLLDQLGVRRHQARLANQLDTTLFERPGQPLTIRLAFRAGGAYDPAGLEGTAHFTEHMLVAGTKTYPSKDVLAQYIEQYGGVFGAVTTSDLLWIDINIADNDDLPKAAILLNEILNHSLVSAKTLASERGSVLRELGNRLSSPSLVLWDMYNTLFFENQPIGRSILGSEQTIAAINKPAVDHHMQLLTASRARLIIAGGTTMNDISQSFGAITMPLGAPIVHTPSPIPHVAQRTLVKHFSINDQIDFIVGFRTCGHASADRAALRIIQTILGGGRAASLTKKLRYEKGYIYAGWAEQHSFNEHDGLFYFKSACAKKDLQATLNIIASEFRRVQQGKLTQDEIAFAKQKITKSLKYHMQTSQDWVDTHMASELYKTNQTINEYVAAITAVSTETLAKVGATYFKPQSWYMALAGDVKEGEFILAM